jgi:ABC-type phosphate/phosphonate transport system substrate-binding protein
MERGIDFRFIDDIMDPRTKPPPFEQEPYPPPPADAIIAEGVPVLNDTNPFPPTVPLPHKKPTIYVIAAHSAYHTRTSQEVLSALAPLFDLIQREVNVRAAAVLCETAQNVYFGLLDGKDQMAISDAFDYLLVRAWLAGTRGNGAIPLSWAQLPYVKTTATEGTLRPGTSILLVVARDAPYRSTADLKGKRLAITARYGNAPGTFLTEVLIGLGHPLDRPFFSKVTLRRYAKDAVIDVLRDKADVACVDEGTVVAMNRFYGLDQRVRTLAASPPYDFSVLYTSENNVATHRTEIELTQRQVTTLGRDPEGQEVLFLFDTAAWHDYRYGDFATAEEHFANYLKFLDATPVDLKPLLNPHAVIDEQTYDRYGDE